MESEEAFFFCFLFLDPLFNNVANFSLLLDLFTADDLIGCEILDDVVATDRGDGDTTDESMVGDLGNEHGTVTVVTGFHCAFASSSLPLGRRPTCGQHEELRREQHPFFQPV